MIAVPYFVRFNFRKSLNSQDEHAFKKTHSNPKASETLVLLPGR